jgi:hypothetical protein
VCHRARRLSGAPRSKVPAGPCGIERNLRQRRKVGHSAGSRRRLRHVTLSDPTPWARRMGPGWRFPPPPPPPLIRGDSRAMNTRRRTSTGCWTIGATVADPGEVDRAAAITMSETAIACSPRDAKSWRAHDQRRRGSRGAGGPISLMRTTQVGLAKEVPVSGRSSRVIFGVIRIAVMPTPLIWCV